MTKVHSLFWSLLTQGGAYSEGQSAACGRALAWQSLAGLCAMPAIDERAAYSWFTAFASESQCFAHVCIDVEISCTRVDGRSLAVFAATDSD